MKKTLFLMILLSTLPRASRAQTLEIPLWPDGPDEHSGITEPELRRPDWSVTNVTEAAIYVWPADEAKNTGLAVLICPGGGYSNQSADHEGRMPARWLAGQGITAVVLKYRLPNRHWEIPLADACRAMQVIRAHTVEWGVDPDRIGVMGFSAGGHLASTLLTQFDEGSRPDFGVLYYPVVTMSEQFTHAGSRLWLLGEDPAPELVERFSGERNVTTDTPPTLIFFSDDDASVPSPNGTMFYNALKAAGVRSSLHIYPSGGHGWGFRENFKYHDRMKATLADWLAGF